MRSWRAAYIEGREDVIALGNSGTGKNRTALRFGPLCKTGAEPLSRWLGRRRARRTIQVTSELPDDQWTEGFDAERPTDALLDRII